MEYLCIPVSTGKRNQMRWHSQTDLTRRAACLNAADKLNCVDMGKINIRLRPVHSLCHYSRQNISKNNSKHKILLTIVKPVIHTLKYAADRKKRRCSKMPQVDAYVNMKNNF